MSSHAVELNEGRRFEFGANWQRFLKVLNDERIALAQQSIVSMLEVETLAGKRFVDVGSGSGLFSLVARRLGASVWSFDFDPQSVACTRELKRRYFDNDPHWQIGEGSVLDEHYLASLGQFDVVYSWGVLHHTGSLWHAIENASRLVCPGGTFYLSIYNDQGGPSRRWTTVKRLYNSSSLPVRWMILAIVGLAIDSASLARSLLSKKPLNYFRYRRDYAKFSMRGMSYWHDLVDWIGGYPFEVAKPEEVFDFLRARGFRLDRLRTCGGGWGCNEFVFRRA